MPFWGPCGGRDDFATLRFGQALQRFGPVKRRKILTAPTRLHHLQPVPLGVTFSKALSQLKARTSFFNEKSKLERL